MQVLTVVRKDILNNIIIENQIDLVSHPHCIVLDIKKRNSVSKKYFRRIRVVNLYDIKIENKCVLQVFSSTIQRAIQDIRLSLIIKGKY